MTFEDFHPLLASTIAGIATEYGRKAAWMGATREDFSQEMIAWLLDNEERVGARFAESVEKATTYASSCLRNECRDYLATLRKQVVTDSGETHYDYGRDELKVLLQLMFQEPDAEAMTYSVVESVRDVEEAFPNLPEADRDILTGFHRDQWTNKMMSEFYNTSEAAMSSRHNRAAVRLQRLIGGQDEGRDPWVGRKSMSNAAARAETSSTYEE